LRKLEQITNYKNRTPGAKPAFTLAEVLVTLVIIGVLATLTIPALITNIQDAQDKSAWKNASSIISQATRMLATDNGGSLNGIFGNSDVMRDKLSTYLSYMQKCDAGTALGSNGQDWFLVTEC